MTKLRDELSYKIDAKASYFSGGFRPRQKFCIDRKGVFPTGLAHRVLDYVLKNELKVNIIDKRIKPKSGLPMFLENLAPYASQYEATNMAIKHGRGCISMPTGTGKSLVIALIAARLNVKTLVVVPSLEIKTQLKSFIKSLHGVNNVTIENIDSNTLEQPGDYDCLIIDEAHHVAAKTYQKLNKTAWANIYYRFCLTATPFRNDTEETLLFESIAGQVIYKLDYPTAVKEKYIVPIEAYYIEIPKQTTDAYTWAEVYSQLVVNNPYRNEVIGQFLTTLAANDISALCLVKEIQHGDLLSEYGFSFTNGQNDSRDLIQAFNHKMIPVLIGTTGILGEGVDTKPAEYVIIAGLGKAKSAFMQQVGRVLRTYPGKESGKIVIIKDRSHKFTLRHFKEQVKILKEEYGVIPTKINI